MFQQILVPLDGSTLAEQAVPVAAQIAHATSGTIHLVHVLPLPIDYSGGLAPVPVMSEPMMELDTTSANDYLQSVATRMLAKIPVTTEVLFGFPAHCILTTTTQRKSDLIVMCSHGRTGFTRWVLGSVAHTLAHESSVPLLVLHENSSASLLSSTGAGHALRVLVPLDGSALAETSLIPAATLASALAAPASASLHLTQVVGSIHEEESENEEHKNVTKEQAKAYLTSIATRLQTTTKNLHVAFTVSVVVNPDVASTLVNVAEARQEEREQKDINTPNCDVIAMSTHGRHGLQRWVMGSVTERVLTASRLPMLIVRPQQ